MNSTKKKIGLFGGTFNPPHIAHSIIAMEIKDILNLDFILFIPSGNHPLKDSISSEHRFNMAKLAFSDNEYFEVSDIEIKKKSEKTYTVDTLNELKVIYKNESSEFYLIIGADNLIELSKWKQPDKLFELSKVVVIGRPGFDQSKAEKKFLRNIIIPDVPLIEISSSGIRKKIKENKPVKYLVHPDVENYILENNLYKNVS